MRQLREGPYFLLLTTVLLLVIVYIGPPQQFGSPRDRV